MAFFATQHGTRNLAKQEGDEILGSFSGFHDINCVWVLWKQINTDASQLGLLATYWPGWSSKQVAGVDPLRIHFCQTNMILSWFWGKKNSCQRPRHRHQELRPAEFDIYSRAGRDLKWSLKTSFTNLTSIFFNWVAQLPIGFDIKIDFKWKLHDF